MNTGLYPQSNGLMGLTHDPWNWRLNDEVVHLGQMLQTSGYESVLTHFQHEDPKAERLGFERVIAEERQSGMSAAVQTADFLRERGIEAERPLYLQFGMFEAHTPYNRFGDAKPEPGRPVTMPSLVEQNAAAEHHFAGLETSIERADAAVGVVLEALDSAGMAENTLVVFTVDHGVEIGTLRAKWSCYDPGLEIGYIARWPQGGLAVGQPCDAMLSNVDHTPTMLDLLGLDAPANLDGCSFADALRGREHPEARRDQVFSMFVGKNEPRCIRTRTHKLIRNFMPSRYAKLPVNLDAPDAVEWVTRPSAELYDLERDPQECLNVADDPDYAAVRHGLDEQLANHLRAVNDPILAGPIRVPYYIDAFSSMPSASTSELPLSGGVR